ncbi:hypothetical protein KGF54_004092 [Candida jiufengensis]|uniref:uncharacterized protein n=1 Tax=Candida jiufengensis TaxID=497108 RepID=UPI002224E9E6|nr:uncharacterized protein KGF54_004092 [Candida jiufengensis]KAI5951018.1 hypothetical protein KGF54_004092 [Candida jiufengensis]
MIIRSRPCLSCIIKLRNVRSILDHIRYQHNKAEIKLPDFNGLDEFNHSNTTTTNLNTTTNDASVSKNHEDLNKSNQAQPQKETHIPNEAHKEDGLLQNLKDDGFTTNNNKMDFQKLSQFIKEAYEKRPTKETKDSNFQQDELDINLMLSNYKKDSTTGFFKEITPSFNNRITVHSIDSELREKLYNKCESALIPTLEKINELKSSFEIYEFYSNLLNNLIKEIEASSKNNEGNLNNNFYLRNLFLENNITEWNNQHDEVIEKIKLKSIANPLEPELNIISLPIITNHIFQKLGFKLYNSQLISTFFNFIKNDFHLYTLCFNQESFNLILKINWIYYGNIDLLNIEKIFNEMKFLGYNGDFKTYQILKIIIDEYNLLCNGYSFFNKFGSKILTKEDNLRVNYLTKEFYKLRKRLNDELAKKDEDLLESLM